MRLLAAAVVLLTVMCHAPLNAQMRILKGSIQKSLRTVTKDGRSVQIEQQSLNVSVVGPGSARISQIDIVMLYDPESKLFWWHYQLGEPRDQSDELDKFLANSALYILGNKIVCFTILAGPGVPFWVSESSAHYSSLAEGQSTIMDAIGGRLGDLFLGRLNGFHEIRLGRTLPFTFYELSGNSNPMIGPKLRAVSRINGEWRIVLDGPNGDSAIVQLNDAYEVISSKVVPREAR